jgi:hypothetical protein
MEIMSEMVFFSRVSIRIHRERVKLNQGAKRCSFLNWGTQFNVSVALLPEHVVQFVLLQEYATASMTVKAHFFIQ